MHSISGMIVCTVCTDTDIDTHIPAIVYLCINVVHCLVVLHAVRIDFLRPRLFVTTMVLYMYLLNSFTLFSWLVFFCGVCCTSALRARRICTIYEQNNVADLPTYNRRQDTYKKRRHTLDLLRLAKRTIINDAMRYNTQHTTHSRQHNRTV